MPEAWQKDRQLLQQYQPAAFHVMDHALAEDNVSHAYLFSGPKGSLKKEMALLSAASLFTDARGIVSALDEKDQNILSRTYRLDYSSLIFLDGRRKQQISKDEVDQVQSRFSRTGGEGNGKRVYIIDCLDNSSIAAQNSLLKFLEEPAGEEVYAFLTSDNPASILETIRSRCVNVSFHSLPSKVCYDMAKAEGLDDEDAFLLSAAGASLSSLAEESASYAYQSARSMLKEYIGITGDRRLFLVDWKGQYCSKQKNPSDARDENMEILRMFLSMLMKYANDVLAGSTGGPAWYHEAVEKDRMRKDAVSHFYRILKISSEQRDKINRNNDLNLLLEQTIYRLEVSGQ